MWQTNGWVNNHYISFALCTVLHADECSQLDKNCVCEIMQSKNEYDKKLSVTVWLHTACLLYRPAFHWTNYPQYLTDYCIPVSDVASWWHLCSARRHYLVVPRHSLSSYGHRAFAVAGPTAWNSLSDDLCDPTLKTRTISDVCLKLVCFQSTSTDIALVVSHFMALY